MSSRLVTRKPSPQIEAEYVRARSSYAICANSPREVLRTVTRKKRSKKQIAALLNREEVFVPILPDKAKLVDVFWLNTIEVVIEGQRFESLCHACVKKVPCTIEGVGVNMGFECTVKYEDLVVIARKRKINVDS